ncbi:hypothetical protein Hanom_Chr09g00865031 [Helianthus anomalus]
MKVCIMLRCHLRLQIINSEQQLALKKESKLPFWSLRFGHFCHFRPKLKSFASGSCQFYCHFGPKKKSSHICLIKSCNFVLFLRGKSGHICLIKSGIYL